MQSKQHNYSRAGAHVKNITKNESCLLYRLIAASIFLPLASAALAAETPAANISSNWQKPSWLTDLSLGVKENYDDNVLLVSGDGLAPKSSWVTTLSPKVGINFAPL